MFKGAGEASAYGLELQSPPALGPDGVLNRLMNWVVGLLLVGIVFAAAIAQAHPPR
jgi:hypothetical protein